MERIAIPVAAVEFDEGGDTIWVQSIFGTVLRIKCTGKIIVDKMCKNIVSHADMLVEGDVKICAKEGSDVVT